MTHLISVILDLIFNMLSIGSELNSKQSSAYNTYANMLKTLLS